MPMLPRCGIEALEQREERRLAGARRSDDRGYAPGRHVEREVPQDPWPVVVAGVAEPDTRERDGRRSGRSATGFPLAGEVFRGQGVDVADPVARRPARPGAGWLMPVTSAVRGSESRT